MGATSPVVLKFGGTSVQDEQALRRMVGIVTGTRGPRVVVVSALAGVTNTLSDAARLADSRGRAGALATILDNHFRLASALIAGAPQQAALEHLVAIFRVASCLLGRPGPLDPAERDAVLAVGELASSRLVAAVLAASGVDARWVDSRRAVVTDDRHGAARPRAAETRAAVAREILPHLEAGRVPVLGGFVGATPGAVTTTLGRGGSDYSASIVSAALNASRVEIWTDVDGLLSADPRLVADAMLVERVSTVEAYDLARFGARVLHAGALEPVAGPRIPVLVRNSRRPAGAGTEIRHALGGNRASVAGVAHRSAVSVIELVARDLGTSAEFLGLVAECVDHSAHHAVTPVAVSPQRAVVAVDDKEVADEIGARLAPIADMASMERGGLVAVVGHGVQSDPAVWRAVLGLRERLLVRRVLQSSSGCALVAVTAPDAVDDVVRELHALLVSLRGAMEVA